MLSWSGLGLQNILSTSNYHMDLFHDLVLFILLMIMVGVLLQIISLSLNSFMSLLVMENTILETIWTLFPGIVLIYLGIPSLHTLYLTESNMFSSAMAVKVVGHQWYWSYEIGDSLDYNSYMVPEDSLKLGDFRLLETDNKLVLPVKMNIRFMMSSSDVIHSWALPSMGVKMDCTPGRLNQLVTMFNIPSIYYGQCSEICGSNHSFMPISVESTTFNSFNLWFLKMLEYMVNLMCQY